MGVFNGSSLEQPPAVPRSANAKILRASGLKGFLEGNMVVKPFNNNIL